MEKGYLLSQCIFYKTFQKLVIETVLTLHAGSAENVNHIFYSSGMENTKATKFPP